MTKGRSLTGWRRGGGAPAGRGCLTGASRARGRVWSRRHVFDYLRYAADAWRSGISLAAIDGMNIHEIVLTTDFSRDDLFGEARRERIRGEARERKIDTERASRRGAPV